MPHVKTTRPRAIAMWEFSWIERRWPGAGYEDWNQALDELVERGYDAVRIDAFPHLIAVDPSRTWTIHSDGQDGDWGAPGEIDISRIDENLVDFIARCDARGVAVGLSTWYKRDSDNARMRIQTPEDQARVWLSTLDAIKRAGLLDALLFLDLCNEFPNTKWAPYLYASDTTEPEPLTSARIIGWMRDSIAILKQHYPDLDYTFSQSDQFHLWEKQDVTMLDFLEPHIWITHPATSRFYADIGYSFRTREFQALIRRAKPYYLANKAKLDAALAEWIGRAADWSRRTNKPLVTTEGWASVMYRDWPMADWDWMMNVCAAAVEQAAATRRWTAICTSNFCGPQYRGMWRDIGWHRRLTDLIKSAAVDPELRA
jgi:sugar-binding cellulase-like protein